MSRVPGGTHTVRRRKKLLKLAKGYYGARSRLKKTARESVERSLKYAYRDRRRRKRDFRSLWIIRINAASRTHGLTYARLVHGLNLASVELDRKTLADLAVSDPAAFEAVCETAREALTAG
jgi:large subunit ribosomal protein L20